MLSCRTQSMPPRGRPSLLRLCTIQHRCLSSTPPQVAILGGGISGLASAYYLTKADPSAHITLYESSARLGGWIQTDVVKDSSGQKRIVFERGPHTLRPSRNSAVTTKLFEELNLHSKTITVARDAPAVQNRYLYDGATHLRIPNPQLGPVAFARDLCAARPWVASIAPALCRELRRYGGKGPQHDCAADESVAAFLTRRFNGAVADVASAVLHGVYAGDVDALSAHSLFPGLVRHAQLGSVVGQRAALAVARDRGMIADVWDLRLRHGDLRPVDECFAARVGGSGVFTLEDGLGGLVDRLEEKLLESGRVRIRRSAVVQGIVAAPDKSGGGRRPSVEVKVRMAATSESRQQSFDTVVSALPHHVLQSLYPDTDGGPIPSVPTVTVMVVNLHMPHPVAINNSPAFGYLLPRTVAPAANPESALGVLFHSFAAPGQDAAPGAKLTVMLGGHWWDGVDALPSPDDGVRMARDVLSRHLGVVADPLRARASLLRHCIPQYTVGHHARMRALHRRLRRDFAGALKVVGASYGGVAVNDCLRGAWELGVALRGSDGVWAESGTGLERYERPAVDVALVRTGEGGIEKVAEL